MCSGVQISGAAWGSNLRRRFPGIIVWARICDSLQSL
jgi:hypothetical protein